MNRALNIKNWIDGGNNYVLKASAKNKWSGFQESVIIDLSIKFDDNFNIVIWTNEQNDDDYYCIPFKALQHVFIEKHKTTGKYPNRWTAVIHDHQFLMHSNSQLSVDISSFYAKPLFNLPVVEIEDDFFIENAKAEINIRLGQSKFRKGVLKNFGNKCALSEISELSLLTASHIVPWAHKKNTVVTFPMGFVFTMNMTHFLIKAISHLQKPYKLLLLVTRQSYQINCVKNFEYLMANNYDYL